MMTTNYPGNPDLPLETQNRVIATFSQTLDLYTKEKMTDVLVGCDFILKLDPLFQPATDLMTKVQNPDAPVDLGPYIRTYLEETPQDSLDDLLIQAIEALNKREYAEAISLCQSVLQKDPTNSEARDIGQKAQEESEKETFINQFFDKAQEALASGNSIEALASVEKGLALDPENEGLLSIKQRLDMTPPTIEPAIEGSPESPPEIQLQNEAIDVGGEIFEMEDQPSAPPPAAEAAEPAPPPAAEAAEPVPQPPAGTSFEFEESTEIPTPPESTPEAQPTAPPPPDETGTPVEPSQNLDFSFGMADKDGDADERIKPILEEGDIAFREGRHQEAIDIWSRIYLIDMNSSQANERIERAKTAMAEEERKVEEIFNLAVTLYDQDKINEAKEKFLEVLKEEPQHLSARSYIQKIEKAEAPAPEASSQQNEAEMDVPLPGPGDFQPEPELEIPKKKSKAGVIAILVAIIALCITGFFLYPKIFPPRVTSQPKVLSADILVGHAKQLYELGKVDEAIQKLNQIQQNDPLYSRALELIQQYRQSPQNPVSPGQQPTQHDFDTLVKQAREAIGNHKYLKALDLFTKASGMHALTQANKSLLADATAFAENFKSAQDAMNARDYAKVILLLKGLKERYPSEIEATTYLADAYYNQGVDLLKSKKTPRAEESFARAVELNPEDAMAKKNLKLCRFYQEYPPDLLFRIYTKYLPYR